jgi:molybdenum cofactor guanylyltransferase
MKPRRSGTGYAAPTELKNQIDSFLPISRSSGAKTATALADSMHQFEAFILIGGRSSRLGSDKAFVELGGRTLVEHAVENVRTGLSPERMTAVAGSSTQFAIQAIIADVPFIFDLHEGRGPLGGIHAALAYARTPWIFVLACDYPFVSGELIRFLADRIDDEFGALVPEQHDGRMQPLCGFYKVDKARPVIDDIIERPSVPPPMHEVVGLLNPRVMKFAEYEHLHGSDEFFVNINTVEDLERARRDGRDESHTLNFSRKLSGSD